MDHGGVRPPVVAARRGRTAPSSAQWRQLLRAVSRPRYTPPPPGGHYGAAVPKRPRPAGSGADGGSPTPSRHQDPRQTTARVTARPWQTHAPTWGASTFNGSSTPPMVLETMVRLALPQPRSQSNN